MYMVHRTWYMVHRTSTMFSVPCTGYCAPCIVYHVACTMYHIPCIAYHVPYTMYCVTVYDVPWICMHKSDIRIYFLSGKMRFGPNCFLHVSPVLSSFAISYFALQSYWKYTMLTCVKTANVQVSIGQTTLYGVIKVHIHYTPKAL